MGIDIVDASGQPRPVRDIESALRFVEAEMVVNATRMGPKDTGPAVIHYMTIRDALRELLGLREQQAKLAQSNAVDDEKIHALDERLHALIVACPPMTADERIAQGLDFAYGNLGASTRHKPVRDAFKKIALNKGWSEEQFEVWAKTRAWFSVPETYSERIDRVAKVLKERISKREYADLRDILGDYTTDEWFCKRLRELDGE